MFDTAERLLRQAFQACREKRLSDARADLIKAVNLCREAGVRADLARVLTRLGQLERDLRDSDAARRCYEESAALYCLEGDSLRLAHTVRHLGDVHREDGRIDLSEECYGEALSLYRGHAQTPALDLANALRGLAVLKQGVGRAEQARSLWEEARTLYTACEVEAGVAESSRQLALLSR